MRLENKVALITGGSLGNERSHHRLTLLHGKEELHEKKEEAQAFQKRLF